MFNLEERFQRRLNYETIDSGYPVVISPNKDETFFVGNHMNVFIYQVSNQKFNENHKRQIEGLAENDFIISIAFSNSSSVFIGTKNGLIILWEDFPSGEFIIKSENTSGYDNIAWSDDSRYAATHTIPLNQSDDINGFVYLWDTVSQFTDYMSIIDLNNVTTIEKTDKSIGWGEKNTQFIGKGIKHKVADKEEKVTICNGDDKNVILSWRPDGVYLAVSYFDNHNNIRKTGVWSSSGVYVSQMEHISALCPVLSWVPSSGLLSCIVQTNKDYTLINYERNGLKRLSYVLGAIPLTSKIVRICWSRKSDILAIHVVNQPESQIYFYIQSNILMYLKARYSYSDDILLNYSFLFDMSLFVVTSKYIVNYDFRLRYTAVQNVDDHFSTVAIIDGNFIYFTLFGKIFIPPPLCSSSVKLPFVPTCVLVSSHLNTIFCHVLAFNLPSDGVAVIKIDTTQLRSTPPRVPHGCLLEILPLSISYDIDHFRSPRFVSQDKFVVFAFDKTHNSDRLILLSIDFQNNKITTDMSFLVHNTIFCVCDTIWNDSIVVQFLNKQLFEISLTNKSINLFEIQSDQLIRTMNLINNPNKILIYRTQNFGLFINNTNIHFHCADFVLSQAFLLVSLKTHHLMCLPLQHLHDASILHNYFINCREIERGSRLVTVVPYESDVIIETSRVEVQMISPRQLVTFWFIDCINKHKYQDGLLLLKRHRVDYNIMLDHDPSIFLNQPENFINQIDDPSHLINLIESLTIHDSTINGFKYLYPPDRKSLWNGDKVATVTSIFKDTCMKINEERYKMVIILCMLKQNENNPIEALRYISKFTTESSVSKESAILFLKQHMSSDDIYKTVLGCYDLDLAMIVARVIGKDPTEYVPYIKCLQLEKIPYRYFVIDCELKQYNKALKNIILCENRDKECLEFIKKHELQTEALKIMEPSHPLRHCVSEQLAEILSQKHRYSSAAAIYYSVELYEKAFRNYCRAGSRQEAVLCLHFLPQIDIQTRNEHLTRLSNKLVEKGKHLEAADIISKYIQDGSELRVLIDGKEWKQAYYHVMCNKEKYSEVEFKNNIIRRAELIIHSQNINKQQIESKVCRLLELRKPNYIGLRREQFDSSSDTISVGSDSSSFSSKLSKSKKKSNKKSILSKYYKEVRGSEYEDFAIMHSLYTMYSNAKKELDEIKQMTAVLTMTNMWTKAQELCDHTNQFTTFLKQNYKIIWSHQLHLGPFKTCNQNNTPTDQYSIEYTPILAIPENSFEKIDIYLTKQH